jgi:hypothetical protein
LDGIARRNGSYFINISYGNSIANGTSYGSEKVCQSGQSGLYEIFIGTTTTTTTTD